MRSPFLVPFFATIVLGSPAKPTAFCSVVNKLVTAAHQTSQATAFCSSYLHIATSTVTTTVSTEATVYTPVGCTAPAAKRTPDAGSEAAANVAARELDKRVKAPVPKPSCFKTYTASVLLSSACSCLSIPTGTVTSTTTTFTGTTSTPLTFHLSAAGVGYATAVSDGLSDGDYNVRYGGALADANNFFVDQDTIHPNLYLDGVPANDISLMYERHSNPGLLYFNVNGVTDQDIENVKCTVEGYPGTCHLQCVTESNLNPENPDSLDGHTVEQLCSPSNTWWLDQNLDTGCSGFTPIVVPID